MSQLSQQNDGLDSQLQFFPQDSPTIGRNQAVHRVRNAMCLIRLLLDMALTAAKGAVVSPARAVVSARIRNGG